MKYLLIAFAVYCQFGISAIQVFENADPGFSFSYDDALWERVSISAAENSGAAGELSAAQNHRTVAMLEFLSADEKYHPRFSVVLDGMKTKDGKKESLSEYWKRSVKFLKEQRFTVYSAAEIKLDKLATPAFEVIADQRDFGLTFRQVVFEKSGQAFVLTAACRTKSFPAMKDKLDLFFKSFRLNH